MIKVLGFTSLILTMYFLRTKGENELNFSIFWKSVVCTKKNSKT